MSDPTLPVGQHHHIEDPAEPTVDATTHPISAYTADQIRDAYHHPIGVLPAIQSLLYVLVVALFLITFTVQPIRIPSPSMEPTLLVGDFLLLDKQAVASSSAHGLLPPVSIDRGDVVVFHDPVDDPSIHLVKRVIALPGDRIHLRDGVVYLNGTAQKEAYAIHRQAAPNAFRDDFPNLQTMDDGVNPNWWIHLRGLAQDGEVTVPPNSYFVMGDNRNNSEDSRYWGFVPRQAIVGKPLMIYFSWCQPNFEENENSEPIYRVQTGINAPGKTDFARWNRTFRIIH